MNALTSCEITSPSGVTEECALFSIDDTSPFILHDITTVGWEYTFNCWIKSDAMGSVSVENTVFETTSEWIRIITTFSATRLNLAMTFAPGTYYVYHPKLEIGNTATDWTPAPEDVDDSIADVQTSTDAANAAASDASERVTVAESLIQQLSDCISMLVTDANGTSLMTQTSDGWTFSLGNLQSAVDSTSEGLATLTEELGSTEAAVSVLEDTVADLASTTEYIRIRVYEDEPCIEMGESDSNFKLLITNTRIMFMDGSNVPTYISNRGVITDNIEIENELMHTEWVWKRRSNGNLGLMWKGWLADGST